MRKEILAKLYDFYRGEIPGYVKDAGKNYLTIRIEDWGEKEQDLKITLDDVVEYYATEAGNIMSGVRRLAGYVGDWRSVNCLAKECLEWFKFVNIDELRRKSEERGLIPRF